MVKLANIPIERKAVESAMCVFCDGKELAIMGVTGQNFPMGESCWNKVTTKGVSFTESTSLTELKRLIRAREKGKRS